MEKNKMIDAMIGKTFQKDGLLYNFMYYKTEGKNITIVTDKEIFETNIFDLKVFQSAFKPVEQSGVIRKNELTPVFNFNIFTEDLKTLSDVIQNVKEDKNFVPQAMAINDILKTRIEYGKLAIQMTRIIKS